jgi:hypothetical protein
MTVPNAQHKATMAATPQVPVRTVGVRTTLDALALPLWAAYLPSAFRFQSDVLVLETRP